MIKGWETTDGASKMGVTCSIHKSATVIAQSDHDRSAKSARVLIVIPPMCSLLAIAFRTRWRDGATAKNGMDNDETTLLAREHLYHAPNLCTTLRYLNRIVIGCPFEVEMLFVRV
jgi:hypothetical protein